MAFYRTRRIKGRRHADFPQSYSQKLAVKPNLHLAAWLLHPPANRDDCLILRHPLAEGDSAMKQWKSLKLWLASATALTALLLATTPAVVSGQGNSGFGQSHDIPSPEPATLTLLALGGGVFALVRYRKSRRK